MNGEIKWLEPKKDPISGAYLVFSANDSDMEPPGGIEPPFPGFEDDTVVFFIILIRNR